MKSPLSYCDSDADDLDFVSLPVKNSSVSVTPLRHGDEDQSHGTAGDSDAACCSSVCAPILVVPSSDSLISLIRTPDSSPDRRPIFSPSQARYFQLLSCDS